MFDRAFHPISKAFSRPARRPRRAKALQGSRLRPQLERLEDRTLLSATSQALVAQMYQDLLQRPADAAGLANWSAALDHGASPTQVALDLAQSAEGRALQVQTLYQQFLHRGADPSGLNGFAQALAAGQTLEQIATALATSAEYYQTRGGATDSGFLSALYQDAFSRPIDASGAATHAQALASGETRAQVVDAVFASTELQQDIVAHDYQSFLHRAADADGLSHWTQALQHGMRDEQIAAALAGSAEYAQNVQSSAGALQQTLLPEGGVGLPVVVTNTPSQPIPVTGSLGVGGTVQAQQSGVWTVGISGTPTVNIGNAVQVASSVSNPVSVRDVNEGFQPYQAKVFYAVHTGDTRATASTSPIPPGKRLVLQTVGVDMTTPPSGQTFGLFVLNRVGGQEGDYPLTPTPVGGLFSFTQPLTIYADPGTVLTAGIVTPGGALGFIFAAVTFSGYLVNLT